MKESVNKFYKPFENDPKKVPSGGVKGRLIKLVAENFEQLETLVPSKELHKVSNSIKEEIERIRQAADPKKADKALTKEVAENIAVLWDFSGPGNYDDAYKNDRYTEFSWTRGMERQRLNYTAWLSKKIAERISGINEETDGAKVKSLIEMYGPKIIYNGDQNENKKVIDLLERDGIIIPRDKLIIPPSNIEIGNTVDQIKGFSLPKELHKPGKEIGIISHEGQLARMMHIFAKFKTIPSDMKVRLFPVATPDEGIETYTKLEIAGTLMGIYLKNYASKESYPYVIHGEE